MFEIGSVVAKIKADSTDFKNGLNNAKSSVGELKESTFDLGGAIKNVLAVGATIGAVVGVGIARYLGDSVDKAREFNKQMITLGIISERFGVSADKAKEAAKSLSAELNVGVGTAAESLQNLLKSGLNLDQASELMKRFTNEAITGKSASISLDQAVQNLSFAYATGNSALGNMSGISENFSDITEKGRQALVKKGMALSAITDDMAKYQGMIDLTNLTLGSSDKIMDEGTKKTNELKRAYDEFQIQIGNSLLPLITLLTVAFTSALTPAVKSMGPTFTSFFDSVNAVAPGIIAMIIDGFNSVVSFWDLTLKPALVVLASIWSQNSFSIVATVKLMMNVISGIFQIGMSLVTGIIGMALELISGDFDGASKYALQMLQGMFDGGKRILDGLLNYVKGWGGEIVGKLTKPFQDAWGQISDLMNKIKDALDLTKRHSPSVIDILNKGVSEANKAFSNLTMLPGSENAHALIGGAITQGGQSNINISINLDGAVIADEYSAQRISEVIGDGVINKLKGNLRI